MSTMDYHKFYRIDHDGNYNLHFANKNRLSESEIYEIFSSYGKVLHVNYNNGFTFIKYQTLKETKSCVSGLNNSSKIQLLLEKSKLHNFNRIDKRNSSQQQAARTFNNNTQLDSNSIDDKNLPNRENSTRMRTSNENNKPNNFSDTKYQNSMHIPNLNVIRGTNELDSSVFNKKLSLLSSQQTSMEINSSDTTINYEKYYKILKDNSYCVHFINRKGLTFDQLNERFLHYGNVLSINSGGESNELRYVRYKTLEEIKRCIKGLQNSDISLLPQKSKVKVVSEMKTTDERSLNLWQAARTRDPLQRTFSTGKQFDLSSTYNERSLENREESIYNTKAFDLNKLRDTDYFSDTASRSSRQDCKSNEIKYKNTNPQMSNEKNLFLRQDPMNNKDHDQVMRKKQQKTKLHSSMETQTNTKIDRNMQISTYDYELPALISDTEAKSNESDVMSDSFLSNGIKNSSSKIVFVPMQELIVANIHANYGVHYILHLFDKHGPISATLVKTIAENNIRYCHVYFKTVQDAIAVEKEFDNFDLSGKNLIVLRKSRLLNEII